MSFDLNGSIFAGSSVDVNFHCLSASVPHDQRVTGIDPDPDNPAATRLRFTPRGKG